MPEIADKIPAQFVKERSFRFIGEQEFLLSRLEIMPKFTEEELKNLSNLIISIDNKNVDLGLSILNNSKEEVPLFYRELVLVAELNENNELQQQAKTLLGEHFSQNQYQKWRAALRLFQKGKEHSENNSKLQDLIDKHEAFRPEIQSFMEQHRDYSYHYYKIGRHLHLQVEAHLDLAEAYYRIFLESNPNDEIALYCLAYLLAEYPHAVEEAKTLYEKVYAINPQSHGAVNNIGHIYDVHYQDYEKAYEFYQKALNIAPKESRYMRNLSKMCVRLKREGYKDKGRALLLEATEIQPEVIENWKDLGDFYWEQDRDYSTAQKTYQSGLNRDPNNEMILSNMGELHYFILKRYHTALSYFRKALKTKKTRSTLAIAMTLLVEKLQDWDEAKIFYDDFLQLSTTPLEKPKYLAQSKWDEFLAAEIKLKKHFKIV